MKPRNRCNRLIKNDSDRVIIFKVRRVDLSEMWLETLSVCRCFFVIALHTIDVGNKQQTEPRYQSDKITRFVCAKTICNFPYCRYI